MSGNGRRAKINGNTRDDRVGRVLGFTNCSRLFTLRRSLISLFSSALHLNSCSELHLRGPQCDVRQTPVWFSPRELQRSLLTKHPADLHTLMVLRSCIIRRVKRHLKGNVAVRQHSCPPFDNLPEVEYYRVELFACKGFFVVAARKKSKPIPNPPTVSKQHLWLYDLSTASWSELPDFGGNREWFSMSDIMCELQWSVIPKTQRRRMFW